MSALRVTSRPRVAAAGCEVSLCHSVKLKSEPLAPLLRASPNNVRGALRCAELCPWAASDGKLQKAGSCLLRG